MSDFKNDPTLNPEERIKLFKKYAEKTWGKGSATYEQSVAEYASELGFIEGGKRSKRKTRKNKKYKTSYKRRSY